MLNKFPAAAAMLQRTIYLALRVEGEYSTTAQSVIKTLASNAQTKY